MQRADSKTLGNQLLHYFIRRRPASYAQFNAPHHLNTTVTQTVGGEVALVNNFALQSTAGLASLGRVGISLVLMGHPLLKDLDGFGQIAAIPGDLVIHETVRQGMLASAELERTGCILITLVTALEQQQLGPTNMIPVPSEPSAAGPHCHHRAELRGEADRSRCICLAVCLAGNLAVNITLTRLTLSPLSCMSLFTDRTQCRHHFSGGLG